MVKLIHVTTIPQTLGFVSEQIGFLKRQGFEIQAVSSPGAALRQFGDKEQVTIHSIPMTRSISPLRDLAATARLFVLFVRQRPTLVHAHTPKAGLLAMIAARMARVPCRIFHIHGLAHVTATGFTRCVLRCATKVSCVLAVRVLCVSQSNSDLAVIEGLCLPEKIKVPAFGSSNGVDALGRFCPQDTRPLRQALGLREEDLAIGFAGRLVRDKGVCELQKSWMSIREEFPTANLVIAGEPEKRDAVPTRVLESLRSDDRVHLLGWFTDMPAFYSVLDVLVLPSYREGFPTVILESAAMEVPAIATRSTGCVDAVVDGVTGLLVNIGDHVGLANALRTYLLDPSLRAQHGRQARHRVLKEFRPEDIWQATLQEYRQALAVVASSPKRPAYSRAVKRIVDRVLAFAALLIFSPFVLFLALLMRLRMGSPVFFRQVRPGLDGRLFTILKFRTMTDERNARGELLSDAERLKGLGKFLRDTSLDELPELWNVLKGDMSLVGPRPLLPEYLPRYTSVQHRRHEVKPGITGWAQVNGRNSLSWEEKFELDVWYVDNLSWRLDWKILCLTLLTVFRQTGIHREGHVTMPKFAGKLPEAGDS